MEVIEGVFHKKQLRWSQTVLTVGNFDGVHLGHRALIQKVTEQVSRLKAQGETSVGGGMLTFNPHPLKVLLPEKHPKNIFELSDRLAVVTGLGLDFVVVEPFSRELSELTPESFFQKLLVDALNVKFLFVGHDFSFGKNRAGTLDVLKKLAHKFGVHLEVLPPVQVEGDTVSSTKIRDFISQGEMEKVKAFLGRSFFLKGVIEKGAGRGKKIGFPTANLFTAAELFPKRGVYVTFFEIGGKVYHGVTNVGLNPTFEEKTRRPIQVETYILDFDKDIYGESVKVSFLHFLRDEKKFNSIDDLIKNIGLDVDLARKFPWPKF